MPCLKFLLLEAKIVLCQSSLPVTCHVNHKKTNPPKNHKNLFPIASKITPKKWF